MSNIINENPLVIVMSNKYYLALAIGIACAFWIILNAIDQLLFFWPIVTFYLPPEKLFLFIITNVNAGALGVVIGMNVYLFKSVKIFKKGSLLSASALSVASCACVGCSTIGLTVVTSFGSLGATALVLSSVYQLPIRLATLAILGWTYYTVQQAIYRNYRATPKNS